MDKKTLRKIILELRKRITAAEARTAGEAIASLLSEEAFWRDARSIFCFISVEGEPDTAPIILKALEDGKTVFVPRTAPGRQMETVPLFGMPDHDAAFRKILSGWPHSYGIPEPPLSLAATDAIIFDLVIVPSLAVDRSGYRLGHGGGYYDNFIASKKGSVFAAIQFAVFLYDESLPHEAHDMQVDVIVTENGIDIPLSFV